MGGAILAPAGHRSVLRPGGARRRPEGWDRGVRSPTVAPPLSLTLGLVLRNSVPRFYDANLTAEHASGEARGMDIRVGDALPKRSLKLEEVTGRHALAGGADEVLGGNVALHRV